MGDHQKRRQRDTGWQRAMQGGPMALTLLVILITAVGSYAVLHSTVAGTTTRVQAQWAQIGKVRERVTSAEQGQAVIQNDLKYIRAEQKRLGDKIETGQREILREIRRQK